MHDDHLLHLARIKLDELRSHHDALETHYQSIEERLGDPQTRDIDKLEALVEGLSTARFAMKALHPEANNLTTHLSLLRAEAELGRADGATLQRWIARLEEEIERGRTRTRFSYLFGLILEEDMAAAPPPPHIPPPTHWPAATSAVAIDPSGIDAVIDARPEVFEAIRERVAAFSDQGALAAVGDPETNALLQAIVANPQRDEALRTAARDILANPGHVHEYSNVLTILLHHFPRWDWSSDGVRYEVLQIHAKDRAAIHAPLLDHLLVNLLGMRWGIALRGIITAAAKMNEKPAMPVPPDTIAGGLPIPDDHRRDWERHRAEMEILPLRWRRDEAAATLALSALPASLDDVREGGYRADPAGGSPTTEEGNTLNTLLREVRSQIETYRLLFPDRPLYVLQSDLTEFFASVPHEAVLVLADRLGFPEPWQEFLSRWLAVPVRIGDTIETIQRGVAPDHLLSWVFTSVLGWMLDLAIVRDTGSRPLRVVDDLFLIAESHDGAQRAWQTLSDFTSRLGLSINLEKSGYVRVEPVVPQTPLPFPEPPPEGLAGRLPRWGCLRLQTTGAWHIDETRLDTLLSWIRDHLQQATSVLDLVQRYNGEVRYVIFALGIDLTLAPDHLEAAGKVLIRMHQDLFRPGHGVVEQLQQQAARILAKSEALPLSLPEPLIYWPITAGGLGLFNPTIPLVATRHGRDPSWTEPLPPPEWQIPATRRTVEAYHRALNEHLHSVSAAYDTFASPRPFAPPPQIASLTSMVEAFIARGSQIGAQPQSDLSVYWRWIVATYGPLLLDTVGTFSFLPTELVPLPLILKQRSIVLAPTPSAGRRRPPPPDNSDDIPF